MIKQVDEKTALMQSKKFKDAYNELEKMIREGEYSYIFVGAKQKESGLDYYLDSMLVKFHPEYKVKYGDLWLMFAELENSNDYLRANNYGFVIVEFSETEV